MSAFIVSPDTIDLIVSAAMKASDGARFVLKVDARDAISLKAWLNPETDAQALGTILYAENYHSVNVRYSESDTMPDYTFRPVDVGVIPNWRDVALKSLNCLNYQACESNDYDTTNCYKLVEWITGLLGGSRESAAYAAAPWGWERTTPEPEPATPPAPREYLSTTDHAAAIRKALKSQHGWTSRQVSVRADYYSMGSSIHVTIKDPTIPINPVKAIAQRAESIDYDQSGEILSGGNRFVHIGYAHDALKVMGVSWLGAIDAAFLELSNAESNVLIPIAGTDGLFLGRDNNDRGLSVWGNHSHMMNCYDIEAAAEYVAVQMLNRKSDHGCLTIAAQ